MIEYVVIIMFVTIAFLCIRVISLYGQLHEVKEDIVTLIKICQSLKGMIDALHERTKLKD